MRVFMLGWEFPPFVTGGLGTACYGLTKALSRQGVQVIFVLPKAIGGEYSDKSAHVRLLSPQARQAALGDRAPVSVASAYRLQDQPGDAPFSNVVFKAVPAKLLSPYQSTGGRVHATIVDGTGTTYARRRDLVPIATSEMAASGHGLYTGDLIQETRRYAQLCVDLACGEQFDVIHAHDWMTFPAGLAVAAATSKPLVVHIHSTEFDRSGEHVNQQVYDLERRGMHGAMRVVAVSHLTRSIIVHRYGIQPDKVDVVYNGIEDGPAISSMSRTAIKRGDKIVLFLGRITWQKGPEYFLHAAKKVLEKYDQVKFVMAGTGDMIEEIMALAAAEGIGSKVIFTGFLRGKDVERVFNSAAVYVMPSVSEPFGIAPLEAIRHDVPVIISKTSGVAEVLTHALKVDFWDVDDIANKIIAVLRHPPLSSTLREQADMEVRNLTWDGAAANCVGVYQNAIKAMPEM